MTEMKTEPEKFDVDPEWAAKRKEILEGAISSTARRTTTPAQKYVGGVGVRTKPAASASTAAIKKKPAKITAANVQKHLNHYEKIQRKGLGRFPFSDTATTPKELFGGFPNKSAKNLSVAERCERIASWYVKKNRHYYDVNDLGHPLDVTDIKQAITIRVKETFQDVTWDERTLKDLFGCLLNGRGNPLWSIPVWSGKTVSVPGNPERLLYRNGAVVINKWVWPTYRSFVPRTAVSPEEYYQDEILADKATENNTARPTETSPKASDSASGAVRTDKPLVPETAEKTTKEAEHTTSDPAKSGDAADQAPKPSVVPRVATQTTDKNEVLAEITTPGETFDEFLRFMIPCPTDREMFLDWLSWCLKHEARKPKWAILFYSDKKGTGKSTLAEVLKQLFGPENTSHINGVDALVNRFNKPVISKKLVIAEEVQLSPNSPKANQLKTLISETSTSTESKGVDIETVEHQCCFFLTTNHLPLWLEQGDRRFFAIQPDHQGYPKGEDYEQFTALVADLMQQLASPHQLAKLYHSLMTRPLQGDFNPNSLNTAAHSTRIMTEIQDLSGDVVEELVADFLNENEIVFLLSSQLQPVMKKFAHRNPNAATYTFHRLGWKKGRFSIAGKQQRAWYHPDHKPDDGAITPPDGEMVSLENYLHNTVRPALRDPDQVSETDKTETQNPRVRDASEPILKVEPGNF